MFKSAIANSEDEIDDRARTEHKLLRFGVDFLDDALVGIFPNDLILLGAPSGVGKTQLCCNIAKANVDAGKRVHYIALEAHEYEIERRLKYPLVLKHYYADPQRPRMPHINFTRWLMGQYLGELANYEVEATRDFNSAYKNLFLHYKADKFGLTQLIESVCYASSETDLIIIDHVHYFDFDDDNENRAIKEIAKTVRTLVLEHNRPIVLVAHLRKRDRHNDELVAGLEEFHGSSDLFKIATRVITMAPGPATAEPGLEGCYETYMRIPKNRLDNGITRFSAKEYFDPKLGGYRNGLYEIGWSSQSRATGFELIEPAFYPDWARPKADAGRRGHNHVSANG